MVGFVGPVFPRDGVEKRYCIEPESNPGRIDLASVSGNDPGYHYYHWTIV
jgi:hypothetical protein